jgi:hypothetical protein
MLTVKELIQALQSLEDQDADVFYHDGDEFQVVSNVSLDGLGNVDIR